MFKEKKYRHARHYDQLQRFMIAYDVGAVAFIEEREKFMLVSDW